MRSDHEPLLRAQDPRTCFLVHDALSQEECRRLIAEGEALGYQDSGAAYPPSYRDNDRLVLDDPTLARRLFDRLRQDLPARLVDRDEASWLLSGLNERFRGCRYRTGQQFRRHLDGVHHRDQGERSRLTFMIYLNDAAEFQGGRTRFYASRDPDAALLCSILPRAGSLVVFDHDLWHDGEPVTGGVKYILRSDVMYRRDPDVPRPAPAPPGQDVLRGHLGYVFCLAELSDGVLASGSRDRTIRLWRSGPKGYECAQLLSGHESSVLALAEPAPGVLWSASRDRSLRLWARGDRGPVESGAPADSGYRARRVIPFAHDGAVLSLAVLSGGRVASGSADGTIKIWGPAGDHAATLRGHRGWVWALAALSDGTLASASEDGTVRLWDPESPTDACLAARPHGAAQLSLVELPGPEGALASGGADGVVSLWHRGDPSSEVLSLTPAHRGQVCALATLPGGLLASGAEDDTIRLWRLADRTCVDTFRHADFVRALRRLADGTLASGSYDASIRLWRPALPH